jgi:AcrR family transcriptional regulator
MALAAGIAADRDRESSEWILAYHLPVPRPASTRRRTRKQAKARTRQKLIDALVQVLRIQGVSALTSTRIAEVAGVAQSTFYFHFKGIDEAMTAAGEQISTRMRAAIRERRLRIDLADPEAAIRTSYRASIEALLAHRAFTALFLAQRRDPASPLGAAFRGIVAEAHADLLADMRTIGLTERTMPHLEHHAGLIVAMTLAAIEDLLDDAAGDVEAWLDVLTHTTAASIRQALAARDA